MIRSVSLAVIALSTVAFLIFAGVAITEISYVGSHPYAYGPAKVIAWAAGGGAILSVVGALLGITLLRQNET